jgi:hypothetical protein
MRRLTTAFVSEGGAMKDWLKLILVCGLDITAIWVGCCVLRLLAPTIPFVSWIHAAALFWLIVTLRGMLGGHRFFTIT